MAEKYIKGDEVLKRRKMALFLSFCFLVTSCAILPAEEELPGAPVIYKYEKEEYRQKAVMRGDMVRTKEIKCTYMPAREAELSFAVGGEAVESMFVEKGDTVKKGDLLAQLSLGDLKDQIEEQNYQIQLEQIRLSQAEANYKFSDEQLRLLLEQNQAEKESLEAQRESLKQSYQTQRSRIEKSLEIKRKKLNELNTSLANRQIIAPMDGVVTYVYSGLSGSLSKEGEKVIVISDMNSSVFVVKGSDTQLFQIGQQVEIVSGEKTFSAKRVDPTALNLQEPEEDLSLSEEERLKNAQAYFQLEQPDPTLKEGNSGRITLVLEEKKDTLFILEDAVKSVNGQTVVYYLDDNGLRAMKEVTVGMEADGQVEILEGLNEGDIVIVE